MATQKRIFKYSIDTQEQISLHVFEKPWQAVQLSSYGLAYWINNEIRVRTMNDIDKEICIIQLINSGKFSFLEDEPRFFI